MLFPVPINILGKLAQRLECANSLCMYQGFCDFNGLQMHLAMLGLMCNKSALFEECTVTMPEISIMSSALINPKVHSKFSFGRLLELIL